MTEQNTKFDEAEVEKINNTMKEAALANVEAFKDIQLDVNIHEVLGNMWMDKQRAFLRGDEEKYEEEDVMLSKGTKNTLLEEREFVKDSKSGLEYKNEKVIAA